MQFASGWWIVPVLLLNLGVIGAAVATFGFLFTVAGLLSITLALAAGAARLRTNLD